MPLLKHLMVVAVTLSLVACGTIIGQTTQDVAIRSDPSEAAVTVVDEAGAQVFNGTTPASVTLTKKLRYFKGKSYTVTIEKAGYQPLQVALTPRANGWYIGGNFIFGGLIGWIIVDPLTGGMWTLTPKEVDGQLESSVSQNSGLDLSVVLLERVPDDLRNEMVRVN